MLAGRLYLIPGVQPEWRRQVFISSYKFRIIGVSGDLKGVIFTLDVKSLNYVHVKGQITGAKSDLYKVLKRAFS